MVGGLLELARFAVYRAAAQAVRDALVDQPEVDPQTGVAPEREHPVVPPGVRALGLLEVAKGIDEAGVDQGSKTLALGFGAVDLARPGGRVVHVAVLGRDVEVAQQDARCTVAGGIEPLPER